MKQRKKRRWGKRPAAMWGGWIRELEALIKVAPTPLLVEKVKSYLKIKAGEREFRPKAKFWPSDAAGCGRKVVYSFLGPPTDPPDDRTLRVFGVGDAMHDRYKGYFREMGVLKRTEVPVHDAVFSGKIDATVILGPDRLDYVVELKSIASRGFWKLKEPREDTMIQIGLYIRLSGIPRGIVIYEDKDTQRIKEFMVTAAETKGLIDGIYAKARRLAPFIKKGELPPREFERSDWRCRYCWYKTACWKKGDRT